MVNPIETCRKITNSRSFITTSRRVTLHTGAFGFGTDFVHSLMHERMIFASMYEGVSHLLIAWASLAGFIIIYIDDDVKKHQRNLVKEDVNEATNNQ